jgi:hypothetical protein
MFLSDDLNFLGSNNQKQSVVRRCSKYVSPHLHCPFRQVGVSAACAAFQDKISAKDKLSHQS